MPFFAAPAVDIRIEWGALMHGGIVGGAVFRSPVINLVDAAGEKGQQTGQGVSWREQLESLMPVRLDEVLVHDGTLHFRNFGSDPPVDFAVERIEGRILNLTNVRDEEVSSAAKIDVTARMLTSAPTEVHATFDPFAPLSSFKLALRIADIDVTQANDLLAAYAKLDVVSGTGNLSWSSRLGTSSLTGMQNRCSTTSGFSASSRISNSRETIHSGHCGKRLRAA